MSLYTPFLFDQSLTFSVQFPNATFAVTPLSQEEANALRVVLSGNGVKPGVVTFEDSHSTLEKVQQLLVEKGYEDLALTLKSKISKG